MLTGYYQKKTKEKLSKKVLERHRNLSDEKKKQKASICS